MKTEVSIDEPLNIDWDGNGLLLSDILGTENDLIHRTIEDEVDKELLEIAMKKLSMREKKIVELRFGLNNGGVEKTQKKWLICLEYPSHTYQGWKKKIISRLRKPR